MKFLLVVLCSVLVVAIADPKISTEVTGSEEEFVVNFFENLSNNIDKYVRSFVDSLSFCEAKKDIDIMVPFNESLQRLKDVIKEDDGSTSVCTFVKKELLYVAEPLINAIDGCVSSEMIGATDYFFKAMLSVYRQICSFSGEELLELGHPCLWKVDFLQNECSKNLPNNFTIPFKERTCRDYVVIRPCVEEALKEKCKLPITQKTVMAIFDSALETPC